MLEQAPFRCSLTWANHLHVNSLDGRAKATVADHECIIAAGEFCRGEVNRVITAQRVLFRKLVSTSHRWVGDPNEVKLLIVIDKFTEGGTQPNNLETTEANSCYQRRMTLDVDDPRPPNSRRATSVQPHPILPSRRPSA